MCSGFSTRLYGILILALGALCVTSSDELTIKKLRNLEHQLVSADKRLVAYQLFLTQPNISQQDREIAEARIADLEKLATAGVWLIGGKDLSHEKMEVNRGNAKTLIEDAIRSAEANDKSKAQKNMELASKTDSSSFQADFLLGLHAATVSKDFALARKHFNESVLRGKKLRAVSGPVAETNLLYALNNLALTMIREDELAEAHELWTELLNIRPDPPTPIAENIIRTYRVMLVAKNTPVLKVSDGTLEKFANLVKLVTKNGAAYDVSKGWQYLGFIDSEPPTAAPATTRGFPKTLVGFGTGVVVRPGYVLTSRCLMQDEKSSVHGIRMRCGQATSETGQVLAIDERSDLVLIKDAKAQGSSMGIGVDSSALKEGTIVFGFSPPTAQGDAQVVELDCPIKVLSSKGPVNLYADVQSYAGSNGSIFCDKRGNLIGMISSGARMKVSCAGRVTSGETILKFLQQNIPDFQNQPNTDELDRAQLSSQIANRLVQLETFVPTASSRDANPAPRALGSIFDEVVFDRACLACDGHSKVKCLNRCANGQLWRETVVTYTLPGGQERYEPKKVAVPCPKCSGTGFVRCTSCTNGTEQLNLKAQK